MTRSASAVPNEEHLDRYLEYPLPVHPLMKVVIVEAMEDGVIEHLRHGLTTKCVFRGTGGAEAEPPSGHDREG